MVLFLQKVGRTGHITTLNVASADSRAGALHKVLRTLYDPDNATVISMVSYLLAVALTATILILLALLEDWWALAVMVMLSFARLLNIYLVRHRATVGWKGASEPGEQGDLLILLSQDRWLRMRGAVDDLKAVASGEWLREPTMFESSLVAFATLLVYLDAALAGNASLEGKVLLIILLFSSAALLGIANEYTDVLKMHGRLIRVEGVPKAYKRRLDLAEALVKETGRDDWVVRMGMALPNKSTGEKTQEEGPVTM